MLTPTNLIIASVAVTLTAGAARTLAGTARGPSSSASPYVINVSELVDITSILTVGDSVNNKPGSSTAYRMVGIPDGLGAFDNYDGSFTVLINHEIRPPVPPETGFVRQHGFGGAFVSHWIIRKRDLAVLHGGDQVKQVLEWSVPSNGVPSNSVPVGSFVPAERAMGRLCSADLPLPSAFYNRRSGKGYTGRILMNGEEVGDEGRAFGHLVGGPGAGISYELPSLGKFSRENSLASTYEQDKTVVVGLDDSTPGQVYVYIGEKRATGNEIEKAGLHGGSLYGIKVGDVALEDRASAIAGCRFSLQNFGDVRSMTGAKIQDKSKNLVTEFLRPEDGAWDTCNPNVFYFVTTDRFDTTKDGSGETQDARSRLHRLTFDDIQKPELGGKYDVLLDAGPQQMLDNMTVDGDGNLVVQEDPGNQDHSARIWKYYPRGGELVEIAKHDPARFGDRNGANVTPATAPFNRDEESSGVIEITHLLRKNLQSLDWGRFDREDDNEFDERFKWAKRGYRYYLGVTQAHYIIADDPELVEGGQLYIIAAPRNVR